MSNFTFLKREWPELHDSAVKVVSLARTDARSCCFYARRTLELAIHWLYEHDPALKAPYDDNLSALIYEPSFRRNLPGELFLKVKTIKEVGNLAVHSRKQITERDALRATKELFHFLYWVARTYTRRSPKEYENIVWNASELPPPQVSVSVKTLNQLRELEEQLRERDREIAEKAKELADTDTQIALLREQIAEAKKQNEKYPDDHDYSEAETRDYFIDLLLREAGWPLDKTDDREYRVNGMPNEKGEGFIDYVLWGNDGLPLAVVEAKKTKKDPRIGRQQAKLYADCLEQQFNQRPLIFYTNGYKTWFWDDLNYPPREVQGFYKRDELELLIQRRDKRENVASETVNKAIVERYYQEESIRAVTEHFAEMQRKALIVMATGAGKTRTVIALCELLQRCNWVKRVLFLADRVALVRQAANAFKQHLPDSSPVNLVTEKYDANSRVYISTYPTMMGLINDVEDGQRRFGVGHFDLVIIDEAHRSVYQKYRAIFEYFDSLLVGLTATPKDEVDKNTYSLFDLEKGVPTYSYDLDQAVADGFLVPYKPVVVPIKFVREGIKYDDLSDEEKEEWDAIEWDEETKEVPEAIDPAALNKWLFNKDTVDKVLKTLVQRGQKVSGGDVLGKTIIFAKNHKHALFIEERFNQNYPHFKGAFARVIDNYESYAQSLIDDFSGPQKPPWIAISVDMLDTGIDIPEIVNLVFFKVVRSKTKFFQMIGRGTRLRPDLFGPGRDKGFFYIFDYCGNLEFFSSDAKSVEGSAQESLNTKVFRARVELLEGFRKTNVSDDSIKQLDVEISETLREQIASMNTDNFVVRPHRKEVEKFREPAVWDELSPEEFDDLNYVLAGLPDQLDPEDETAKRFDLIALKLQLAVLTKDLSFVKLRDQVKEIASRLEEKRTIPAVNHQFELILDLQQDEYWADITLPMLEDIRKRLRELVKFIDKKGRKSIFTDFEDELGEIIEGELSGVASAVNRKQYQKKVMSFLKENENHIAIQKLKRNTPITATDIAELERILFESGDLGTREDFEKVYGPQEHLGLFIRQLVGLDREAAKKAFGEYLLRETLTRNQIRFIDQIIEYLTQNGVMDAGLLYEAPFTDYAATGLDGMFKDKDADGIVSVLDSIRNAAVA
ncbi:MAG TPA: DEAD/DEAH box helicase family protein [Pyrinomonadaceae bacterium]|nr:DEAD/DEAH box helicase family protein [Pyrinomonadaceae bacterium]